MLIRSVLILINHLMTKRLYFTFTITSLDLHSMSFTGNQHRSIGTKGRIDACRRIKLINLISILGKQIYDKVTKCTFIFISFNQTG